MYVPLKEMTDEQLAEEYELWHDATVRGKVRAWVAQADSNRNAVTAEIRRRKQHGGS
ncbi:hypothetical protein NKJ09_23020 [Mesorhizobium sp. M0189]|uniref:hypothetical protein n=1 Tax=Mesorhizobium sp. M0189 TaxID=2956909 RepID=UPI0033385E09